MKKIIVMMGGQGVGKGTFSKMLVNKFECDHVETGALLRALPPEAPIAKMIARGELVPDEMLFDLIASKIGDKDVVLDGFPRTLGQAQWLVKQYAGVRDVHVIYLEVSEQTMIERINKRIREGGGRADDADSAAVRRRLDTFWNVTVPAIDWLRGATGIKFSVVNPTDADVNKNFEKVLNALN